MLVVGSEFTIGRPETPLGWLALIFFGVLLLYIFNQGVQSLSGSLYKRLWPTLVFFAAVLVLAWAASTQAGWGTDPVSRVEVFPEDGTHQNKGDGSSLSGTATNSGGEDQGHGG